MTNQKRRRQTRSRSIGDRLTYPPQEHNADVRRRKAGDARRRELTVAWRSVRRTFTATTSAMRALGDAATAASRQITDALEGGAR